MVHVRRWWLAVGLYAVAIFGLSSIPALPGMPHIEQADKLLHGLVYGGLSLVGLEAARRTWARARPGRLALGVILAVTLYGVTDEVHQRWVPGRMADPLDVAADAAGATAFAVAAWLRRRPQRGGERGRGE